MTAPEILALPATKTRKIQLLLELGMTRQEVATLMGIGYGFVQNVFARTYPDRVQPRAARRQILAGPIASPAPEPFAFTRSFGVEIEMYGVPAEALAAGLRAAGIDARAEGYNHDARPHWKLVSDASLTGAHACELVSPVLRGAEGLAQLATVCATLKNLGARINTSCGLHIHFGTEDFRESLPTWKNLVHNYATLEPLIDGFMPATRRGNANIFCRSLLDGPGFSARIDAAQNLRDLDRAATGGNRYFKMNLQAFWRHRTVEFRQHSGSVEFEKISHWILLLARLIEFSKTQRAAAPTFEEVARFATPEQITFYKARTARLAA